MELTVEEKAAAIIGIIQVQISKFAEQISSQKKLSETLYIEDADSTIFVYCGPKLYNFLKPHLTKGYDGSDYSPYDRVMAATVNGKPVQVGVMSDGYHSGLDDSRQWSYQITREVEIATRRVNSLEQWFTNEV